MRCPAPVTRPGVDSYRGPVPRSCEVWGGSSGLPPPHPESLVVQPPLPQPADESGPVAGGLECDFRRQVGLRHHTDDPIVVIDNRDGGDVVLVEETRELLD